MHFIVGLYRGTCNFEALVDVEFNSEIANFDQAIKAGYAGVLLLDSRKATLDLLDHKRRSIRRASKIFCNVAGHDRCTRQ